MILQPGCMSRRIDLAQGIELKSSLLPFLGLADAIISISPNPGRPWPNKPLLRPGPRVPGCDPRMSKEDAMNTMRRLFLILSLLLPVTVLASGVASAETKLAATIFSYDGTDFVRT